MDSQKALSATDVDSATIAPRTRTGSPFGHSPTPKQAWLCDTMTPVYEFTFVAVVCMAQFCTQAAFLGTLVLLPEVGQDFSVTSPPQLAWLVGGYSLTVGTFILVSGRLGDVLGHKAVFVAGLAWFAVWSLVAGLIVYSDYTLAVFSRVLQGVGPALCLPNALAMLGTVYPPGHRKAMVFACFGAVAPVGAVVGGVFASLLALTWWPWAMWALSVWLTILCAASCYIIPRLPRSAARPTGLSSWITALDLPAALLGVTALVLFNFAWTQAPISGWSSATAIAPLVLGVLLFVTFLFVELRVSHSPLLPLDALTADVAFILAPIVCGWATFGIWTLYLVQILRDIRALSPLLTMAWLSPLAVAGGLAAILTGRMLGPWQARPLVVMALALLAFTVGTVLVAFAPTGQVYWAQTFVSMLIMPFGMDMSFPAATLILSDSVAVEHQGIGASLVNTAVNYGIALGVGFAGTVEVHIHGAGVTKEERLRGFRGGLYLAIGLSGLGLLTCIILLLRRQTAKRSEKESNEASVEGVT